MPNRSLGFAPFSSKFTTGVSTVTICRMLCTEYTMMGSNRQRELVPSKRAPSPMSKPGRAPGRQLPKRSKTDRACVNCRTLRRKVRVTIIAIPTIPNIDIIQCTGDQPCRSCSNNELDCTYAYHSDRGAKMTLGSAVEYVFHQNTLKVTI